MPRSRSAYDFDADAAASRSQSDAELFERARTGDADAYGVLIRRHAPRLYRVARSFTTTRVRAEQVLEEVAFEAFVRLHQYRGEARMSSWLARMAMTAAVLRAGRRPWPFALAGRVAGLFETPDDAFDASDEERSELERALDELAPGIRLPFVLRRVEGMSVAECADCLGCSEEDVRRRVFRARVLLERRVLEEGAEASAYRLGDEAAEALRLVVVRRLRLLEADAELRRQRRL